MIISVGKKKFDKIQHPFLIKNSEQSRNRRELPQFDKGHLPKKTIANVILMVKD